MTRKAFCKIILVFISIQISFLPGIGIMAQEKKQLIGRVTDSSDKLPVPYATVQVKELKINTLSGPEGYFQIDMPQRDRLTIEVSYVGYSATRITTSEIIHGDTLLVELKRQLINMEEVVVTATRSKRLLKDVPVPTQIISLKQMENTGLTNVPDIISSIKPGVDYYNEGRGMTFRMQGVAAKYSLFLVDGERIAGENRDNIDYSRLVSGNIERIEIVQGASSSLYGSSAIGGVINLITRTPTNPFESEIYSRFSKFRELENGLNIGTKGNKLSYFANAVRLSSNGYDNTPQTPDLYTVEPYQIYSFFNKAIYAISDKLDMDARFSFYSRERFDVSEVPKHPYYSDLTGGLKTSYKHSEKLSINASIYGDTYNTYDVLERRDNEKRKIYNNTQITGKIITDIKTDPESKKITHHFTSGIEFLYDEMYAQRIQDSVKNNTILSIFMQDEMNIGNKLSFTGGSRADLNYEYGASFSPKASLMYKKDNMIYRTSVASGFRTPGIKERYYDFDLGFIVVRGNEQLLPEKSLYTSIAAEYLTGNTNLSLIAYNNRLKDMIMEIPIEGTLNQYTYENFSSVNIYGTDLMVRTKLTESFTLTSGYSYTHAIDLETKKQLVGTSLHSGTFSLDYFKRMKSCTLGINLNARVYGKKEFINMDEITYLFFNDVYQTYSIWRLSLNNSFLNDAVNIRTGIDNLFNYRSDIDIISIDPGRRCFIALNIRCENLYNQIKK